MTENELLAGYGLPPARPAREAMLAALSQCVTWEQEQAHRYDLPPGRVAVHLARAIVYADALRIVRGYLPQIIEEADPELERRLAMDVAEYPLPADTP